MAQYTNHFETGFDSLLSYVEDSVKKGSVSASMEGGSDFALGNVRCATRIFERYSMIGNNRLSLSVTLFGQDGDVHLSAVASGGSQAMFFKLNTFGEEAFLNKFIDSLENYQMGRR